MSKDMKAITEEEYLAHYGVPNMKWGVWNAETTRKYMGGKGRRKARTDKDLKGRFKQKAVTAARKSAARVSDAIEQRKATKEVAKEQGIKRGQMKAFQQLRKDTLRSHDPEVVERGMHTLTDSELTAKIVRLETEKKVRDLANTNRQTKLDNAKKAEEIKKAAKERKAAGLGSQMLKSTYNATVNYAGKKAVDSLFAGIPSKSGKKTTTPNRSESVSEATTAGETIAAEVLNVETINESKKLPKR